MSDGSGEKLLASGQIFCGTYKDCRRAERLSSLRKVSEVHWLPALGFTDFLSKGSWEALQVIAY